MKNLLSLFILITFLSCAQEVTKENALEILQSKPTYNTFYFAPFHIGKAVLTGDNHKNPQAHITQKYGKLIDKGLVTVTITGTNSWRTSIMIKLTELGEKMCDQRRSDAEHAFVAVCKLKPIAIDTIIKVSTDSTECKYKIEQRDVTDFGEFLGYENGKVYNVKQIL